MAAAGPFGGAILQINKVSANGRLIRWPGLKECPRLLAMYAVAINQGTFCYEPGDALQRTRAQNGTLARVRSIFVIN
jgi:hypothetical protein